MTFVVDSVVTHEQFANYSLIDFLCGFSIMTYWEIIKSSSVNKIITLCMLLGGMVVIGLHVCLMSLGLRVWLPRSCVHPV